MNKNLSYLFNLFSNYTYMHDGKISIIFLKVLICEIFNNYTEQSGSVAISVSKEIISLFTDKYRLPVIHSSLLPIRIEQASLSKEASSGRPRSTCFCV